MAVTQRRADDDLKDAKSNPALSSRKTTHQVAKEIGPSLVGVTVMLSLIFGGCCSNVSCAYPERTFVESADKCFAGLCSRSYSQVSIPRTGHYLRVLKLVLTPLYSFEPSSGTNIYLSQIEYPSTLTDEHFRNTHDFCTISFCCHHGLYRSV